ncbi:DUF6912 family protein [Isoptericola sp. BMS4]|uniref:DUF6912 family protein n=1 Tax=Isoptericola sp. BMS4 TaxID=2527875 RepID=UPI001420C464|nr:hypothetical protein [Isoptericola sp. BMS4]
MRIYVPATLDELASAVVSAGGARWDVPARRAHADTEALAEALPDDDEEAREYAAFLAAADDSLALVAARGGAVPLRVVVSADVARAAVSEAAGDDVPPSGVDVAAVPGAAIVAVHADEPEAAADVRAVLAAADAESDAEGVASRAAATDEVLDDALQRVTDRDLLWYDATEVHQVPRP